MPTAAARLPRRLPEMLSLAALAGIVWWVWPRPSVEPPPRLQCGHPDASAVDQCFVPVAGGTFLMGAQADDPEAPGHDPAAQPHEGPPHEVTVTGFWITESEVIVGTYRACVADGACREDEVKASGGFSTYYPAAEPFDANRDLMPVNSITWAGARDVCAWLGGRLPTEAEWELAARGTDGRRWPWGNQPQCAMPPADDGFSRLRRSTVDACEQDGPVRARALPNASPARVLGMAGNLWEWTADWYADDAYAHHASTDPRGPSTGDRRAQRGGSWTATSPEELRATVRGGLDPDAQLNDVGLRCVIGGAGG
ncbi:MAG: formylglycine-generating enzyme family protein [Alphaproteobacteria bacterium]|nr:formylglycine-generating enzyme family protein [Alphaproteobacteria bacterium]